ncbi:MAG: FeoB-associated Cys-rich membrane protein [Syntrophobacteraceae bacterium]
MWQTILTVIVLLGALVFVARHFFKVFQTGSDCACSGCSSSGRCGGKTDMSPQARGCEESRAPVSVAPPSTAAK